MKTKIVGMMVCALALLAHNVQAVEDNRLVEPGVRIGRVFLGDTRAAVQRRLGKPTKTFKLKNGLTSELWRSKAVDSDGKTNTLEVIYRRGVAVQIEATSGVFQTRKGLSTFSGIEDWTKSFGDRDGRRFRYANRTPRTQAYYDWVKSGVALESQFLSAHDEDDVEEIRTLIVHRRGFKVVPDIGGIAVR